MDARRRTPAAVTTTFSGFGAGACSFFAELAADNSRDWWQASKARYEAEVRRPLELLFEALAPEFGEAKVFRPNRDTRFSKDKSPYKTNAAGAIQLDGCGALYLSLQADGLFVAGGGYRLARDQLARFRAALADDVKARPLDRIVADLRAARAEVGGNRVVKTAPRGYAADHPRIELLCLDGLTASWLEKPGAWLRTPKVVDRVAGRWRALAPLNGWLGQHVGASELAWG